MPSSFHSHLHQTNARRRVVVTGLGALSAAGLNKEALWESLLAGRSGIGPITRFDPTGMASRIAGEVRGFDPVTVIDPRLKPRRMSRQTQLGVAVAMQALEDAGVGPDTFAQKSVSIFMGVSSTSLEMMDHTALTVERGEPLDLNRLTLLNGSPQSLTVAITDLIAAKHISARTVSSACMAGLEAVGKAFLAIQHGEADVILCGGADAPVCRPSMMEFSVAGLASTRNATPHQASRPFDRERDSGVISEGAAALLLESLESALDRGAKRYFEIIGFQSCVDTPGDYPCSGLRSTMAWALAEAACLPDQVDFISAWGPGHPVIDRYETEAIKAALNSHAYRAAIGSIKGVIGNPLAAAGPLQAVSLAMSYQHGLLPPLTNYEHSDIHCDLDYVVGKPRRADLRVSLVNAHSLGGANSTLVATRAP